MNMKTRFNLLIMVTLIFFVSTGFMLSGGKDNKGNGHEIKITIHNVQDSLIYLYHHFGDKQKAVDTVAFPANGAAVFSGEDELAAGIYIVYIPDKVYFEILVNEQNFSIETDTGDFVGNMKVKGSVENQVFLDYQKFRNLMYKKGIQKDW